MPRYSFDLRDGNDLIKDEEGLDLADFDRSQKHAVRALAEIAGRKDLALSKKETSVTWKSKFVTAMAR
jgi:hypothetical protein